jgi:hypothetical protein
MKGSMARCDPVYADIAIRKYEQPIFGSICLVRFHSPHSLVQ